MKNVKNAFLLLLIILIEMFFSSCQMIRNAHCEMDIKTAMYQNNLEAVKEAVEEGANINKKMLLDINPLLYSMRSSDNRISEYLLDAGANPNYIDGDYGISLLMYAAGAIHVGKNNDNIVSDNNCELLLKHGADVNKTGKIGYTALDYAVYDSGSEKTVALLLNHGAKIRVITLKAALEGYNKGICGEGLVKIILEGLLKNGTQPGIDSGLEAAILGNSDKVSQLVKANKISKQYEQQILCFTAAYGNADTVQLLLNKGFSINSADQGGITLIELASRYGNMTMVKYLLSKGAKIDTVTNKEGKTALSMAVNYDHIDICGYLLEHGAKFQVDDSIINVDSLSIACANGNIDMVNWIVAHGYPLTSKHIYNAMVNAAENNRLNILQYFFDKGVSPNINDEDSGETLLDSITVSGSINTVRFLVEHGENINGIPSENWGEPLNNAATFGRTDIAAYLVQKGANVNAIPTASDGSQDDSELGAAIISGSFDIVKLLVENGANLSYKDKNIENKSPLQIAEGCPSKHIIDYLKQKSVKIIN